LSKSITPGLGPVEVEFVEAAGARLALALTSVCSGMLGDEDRAAERAAEASSGTSDACRLRKRRWRSVPDAVGGTGGSGR